QALPAGLPTLEATRTKNLTRPDNVFCTAGILDRLQSCMVMSHKRPTKTDHLPIATVFDVPTSSAPRRARRDFCCVDWEQFNEALAAKINARHFSGHVHSIAAFDNMLAQLMEDIQTTVADHVPESPDTPYAKRWWSKDLAKMRVEKERLSRVAHRHRADRTHPSHREYRCYCNRY
ncbi:hypothetical protein BV20DRAFT_909146, partial [Pilatotrama ljubarskyi]